MSRLLPCAGSVGAAGEAGSCAAALAFCARISGIVGDRLGVAKAGAGLAADTVKDMCASDQMGLTDIN